ncbi:MAG: hypothetical protein KAG56_11365, partial [Sulfurovaceae bacterium]|nr:hypothetical protein [Sulfurovaceae bacterium]
GLGCSETNNSIAVCYALPDNSSTLYKVLMSPNSSPLPTPITIELTQTFNAEGTAYRATDHTLYTFKETGNNVHMYGIDLNNYTQSNIKSSLFHGTVEGAEFYYTPTLEKEILYIISQEDNSKLYAFDPDDWSVLDGYPKSTSTDLSSLAIDPITGDGYAIDDYNYDSIEPKIYKIDLNTGATTLLTSLSDVTDAEGLAFASDGNLYLEDERGDNPLSGRKIYQVNLQTGALTPSAILGGDDDVEGLSCNGTQIAIDKPSISVADVNVTEGDTNTTNLTFTVNLSKEAGTGVTFTYQIFDGNNSEVTLNALSPQDYSRDNFATTVILEGLAQSHTISVPIVGDTFVENNETFTLVLAVTEGAIIAKGSAIGTIIDDDISQGEQFGCSQESYLTTSNDLYSLNLSEGNNSTLKMNYTTDSINAIGYNVKDNFIWGWDLTQKKVVRIDANYTTELFETSVDISEHDITIASKNGFTSGDVSKNGILYLAKPSLDHKLHRFDLNSGVPVYLGADTFSNQTIHFGDFAINPIDNYLYTTAYKVLYRIDPSNANIENLGLVQGDLTADDGGYFHSYVFDKDGNMYFYSNDNNKKVFKLDLSDFDNPSTQAEEFTTLDWVTGSGEGARCANAGMTTPTTL